MTVQWGPEWPELYLGVEFIIGSFTDISSYVRSLDIVRPTSEETGTYSPATMTVVLDNRDGRFSASNLSGPYTSGGATLVLPEITVRYVATWDSVDFPRFTGMVEDWVDEYPENGEDAVTVLTCVDHLARFAQWTGSGAYTSPDGATSGDTSSPASPTRCHSISPGVISRPATRPTPRSSSPATASTCSTICATPRVAPSGGNRRSRATTADSASSAVPPRSPTATYDQPGCVRSRRHPVP